MTKVPWDISVTDSSFSSMVQDRLSLLMYDAFSRQYEIESGSYIPLRLRHKLAARQKRDIIQNLNVCAQVSKQWCLTPQVATWNRKWSKGNVMVPKV